MAIQKEKNDLLLSGSISKGILSFAIPIFIGQLLQQLYNVADAWVIGNFADNAAFAAVSSCGSLGFLIIGFFGGMSMGGSVIISRYFGAKEEEHLVSSVHMLFLFGIISSVLATVIGLILVPFLLKTVMGTPESVLPQALTYTRVFFAGVSSLIMYNICMAIMRALGDSIHPLIYLCISSVINIVLDLIFVAVFSWGVAGAAIATVIAQLVSVVLCLARMSRKSERVPLDLKKLRPDFFILKEVVLLGLPSGVQNAVISMGNIVVQANTNSFGEFAMAGAGAHGKIEGFVFIPINALSMALPTFIGQNLGAKQYDRAKKGAVFGIGVGVALSEIVGIAYYLAAPVLLKFFVASEDSLSFGLIHAKTMTLFYFLLAFSHCAAGVLRGCGKATVPMVGMLGSWCALRITYVTITLKFIRKFRVISWAYPLTWSITSIAFALVLLLSDWTHTFEKQKAALK